MSSPRRVLLAGAALGVGVMLAVVIGEAVLRLFWPQRSAVTVGMFRQDPHAGYSLEPGYENVIRVPEYRVRIRVDVDGYRRGEVEGPGGAPLRVLAIGDSFTFGVGVNAEDAWPEVLETLMDPGGEGRVSVRNGGVGGYGPLRSARLLLARQAAWKPHILVHGIYVGNDLEDARPDTYLVSPRIRGGRMVSEYRTSPQRLRFWLRVHSHLYAFLRERLYDLYLRTRWAEGARYLDPMGRAVWPERIERETWPVARAAVQEIADWAKEQDVVYLVLLIPARYQVVDRAWDAYRSRWGGGESEFDRDHVQRRLREFLDGAGIAHVDLLPAFRGLPGRDSLYYRVDAHWTAEGHRAAARETLAALVSHFPDRGAGVP